jgi:hypothetical protein
VSEREIGDSCMCIQNTYDADDEQNGVHGAKNNRDRPAWRGGKTKKYVLKLKRTIESATQLPTWRAVPST